MSGFELQYCKPVATYVILEELHHALGWGKVTVNGRNVGVDLFKRVRTVMQTCNVHDLFYDDQKINGAPSGWQLLMDYLDIEKIIERPTGETRLLLTYKEALNYGEVFGERAKLPKITSSLSRYGNDPIPDVNLYGNSNIEFSSIGGKTVLSAVATYDGTTLSQVPRSRLKDTIKALTSKASSMPKTTK